uniref:homeobox protein Hox-C11a-like n=1 Tax=Myxine glutinosa TaxID=7769 RepID=UPI00358E0DE4
MFPNVSFACSPRKAGVGTMDFEERSACPPPSLYLPSCTYYVSPAHEFGGVSSFLPSPASRQMSYVYGTGIHSQPVRDFALKEYRGLQDPAAAQWHQQRRDFATTTCAPEDTVAALGPQLGGAVPDVLVKNGEALYARASTPANLQPMHGLYSAQVQGLNGVLPQGFDQFFENAYSGRRTPSHAELERAGPPAACERPRGPLGKKDDKDSGAETTSPTPSPKANEEQKASTAHNFPIAYTYIP